MILQLTLLLAVSWASGSPLYGVPVGPAYLDNPEPYSFDFNVIDEYGNTLIRKEQGDEQGDEQGNKRGSYGYIDAHGLTRQVDYVADDKGFRAVVRTNEPGTDNQNPADVQIQSDAVKSQVPPAYSASLPVASSYARQAPSVYGIAPVIGRPTRQIYPASVSVPVVSNPYIPSVSQPVVSLY